MKSQVDKNDRELVSDGIEKIKQVIHSMTNNKQTKFNAESMNLVNMLLLELQRLQNSYVQLENTMLQNSERVENALHKMNGLAYSTSTLEKKLEHSGIDLLRREIADSIDKAEFWIFTSGISISDTNDSNYGAVYYNYNSQKQKHELIHAESVGYFISFLSYLFPLYKDTKLINLATASGDWLAKLCTKYDGKIIMGTRDDKDIRTAFTFDGGMCCKAFLDLYELTGNKKYLDCGEKIAHWLVTDALNADGSVKPEFDIDMDKFVEDQGSWWRASGSFHSKIAMSLFQLYSINKQELYREAAIKICEWCLKQQRPDGSFLANKYFASIHMHSFCYTLEALLYAYAIENRPEFLAAVEKAINWILEVQEPDGSLFLFYGEGVDKKKASYAISQFIRILVLVHAINHEDRLLDAAKLASKFLVRFQSFELDNKSFGGFYEHMSSYEFIAKHRQVYTSRFQKSFFISGFGTMFAIQALNMLDSKLSYSTPSNAANFRDMIKSLF